ncbi:unnamed protein product [Rodentolepis nana]|uniref:Sortilin_C domain-containing protein n=1 Tax=Rodentolepis nana TaxID=102285 RepID=A0A0R3T2N0_RODNA|nr:unnamed protein product [Rodentolepis nana]
MQIRSDYIRRLAKEDCEKCPALEECEIVVCSHEERGGKLVPITAESCELSCNHVEISCKRYPNGRLDWYPFDPCAVTTTTTPTTTTTTTQAPIILTEHLSPSYEYQNALETTAQVPFFFTSGSHSSDMLQDMDPASSLVEPPAQEKKQSYGLSWLVSEPELELILWVMFGVALLLMLIGFVGLGGFVCYRRRIKTQIKIATGPRYYDVNRQRAYGVVAYDTNTYSPAVEYDKIRGLNGSCYWSPRPDSREPGSVRRISSPQISVCSPYCNTSRHATAAVDHNYVHHASNYRLPERGTPINSAYHLVTFAPPGESIDGICKTSDISFIQGMDSGAISLERHPSDVITMSPDRQLSNGGSSLGGTTPIPIGNETFLVSTYHRSSSFRSGGDGDAEIHGQIIQQQTKV